MGQDKEEGLSEVPTSSASPLVSPPTVPELGESPGLSVVLEVVSTVFWNRGAASNAGTRGSKGERENLTLHSKC